MKTATTLLIAVSAAVASAAATTYTPFTSAEGWTYGAGRPNQGAQFAHDATNGTMTLTDSNWGQKNASLGLTEITLSAPTDSMTFSYTFYNNDNGAMASLALVGADLAHCEWCYRIQRKCSVRCDECSAFHILLG